MKMIEINLLPEDVKLRAKAKKTGSGKGIEAKHLFYIIPALLSALILAHLLLALVSIAKNVQLAMLNGKWQKLEPQRKAFEDFNREFSLLSEDTKAIQQLAQQRINWSEKLNKISLLLPGGVWFNDLSVSQKGLSVQGSVISLQSEEMVLINKFMDNMKSDAAFFKDFTKIELGSVQKRVVGGYDIADFTLILPIRPK